MYNAASEVYSFGIILWELLTGDVPWVGETEASLLKALLIDKRRPELSPSQAKSILGGLTRRCWAHEHARRPSFEQLQRELQARRRSRSPRVCIRSSVHSPGAFTSLYPDSCVSSWQAAAAQSLELLCFVCSPRIRALKQALDEAREIKGELEVKCEVGGGRCEIVSQDATAESLRQLLGSTPTRRFLFSGHCDAPWDPAGNAFRETLAFTEPGGGIVAVEPATLASILGSHAQANVRYPIAVPPSMNVAALSACALWGEALGAVSLCRAPTPALFAPRPSPLASWPCRAASSSSSSSTAAAPRRWGVPSTKAVSRALSAGRRAWKTAPHAYSLATSSASSPLAVATRAPSKERSAPSSMPRLVSNPELRR